MSKPKAIEYELNSWSITYASAGEHHYQASIRYLAKLPPTRPDNTPNHDDHTDRKYFETFEEAKQWIDIELVEDK